MTTVEMNAELLMQLSHIAGNRSHLEKTLAFLRTLTGVNEQTAPQRGAVYQEMLRRLSDFQTYEQGWDDADALPLNAKVVKNFKTVLEGTTDSLLEGWTLQPLNNGTLLLMFKPRRAGINIGKNAFSFYDYRNGELQGDNDLKFSSKAILNTMRRICNA